MNLQTILLKTFVEVLSPIVAIFAILCLLQQLGVKINMSFKHPNSPISFPKTLKQFFKEDDPPE